MHEARRDEDLRVLTHGSSSKAQVYSDITAEDGLHAIMRLVLMS
jgi:hypothetical protein